MRREPLFIRFANGISGAEDIISSFLAATEHKPSIEIAERALENIPDLLVFKKDFKKALVDLIDNGINNQFINYMNSYMKPSLMELVEGSGSNVTGEKRGIYLKEEDTPWVEAIVCYNLSLYLKVYGISQLKRCTVCHKFFSNKGKYAKYCSEACKGNK